MRVSILLLPIAILLGCARPAPAAAQSAIEVSPFRSVALDGGGHVTIRHGAAQRVTLVGGEADVAVEGTQLRIGHCRTCAHRERLSLDIVVPALEAVSVENGGRLVVAGDFPRPPRLAAAVSNGGMLDVRALAADQVSASVALGGMIYTRPIRRLDAAVSHGGAITYWGDPRVQRAVNHGGVVQHGRDEEAERPLEAMMPQTSKLLSVAEVPPVPPIPN